MQRKPAQFPCGFQHHLMVLAGQSVDNVDADLHPTLLQLLVAAQKIGIAVAAVDPLTGDVVDGLQSQLHLQIGALCKLAQIVGCFITDAVGTGGNGKPCHIGKVKRLLKLFPQHRQRSFCDGLRLKIRDVQGVLPLVVHHLPHLLKLPVQRKMNVPGKIPAAARRAVGTAAGALGPIEVWAGKARIQRNLCHLAAKVMAQEVVEDVIPFIAIRIGKRIVHYFFSSAPASSSTKMVTSGCRRSTLAGTFGVMGP